MKRVGTRAAASAATFAPLPPRARKTCAAVSVAARTGSPAHTTMSSTRSPTTASRPGSGAAVPRSAGDGTGDLGTEHDVAAVDLEVHIEASPAGRVLHVVEEERRRVMSRDAR